MTRKKALKEYLPYLGKDVFVAYDELSAAVQALLALPGTVPIVDPADGRGIFDDAGTVRTDSLCQAAVAAMPAVLALVALLSALPLADPGDGTSIWNNAGVLTMSVSAP